METLNSSFDLISRLTKAKKAFSTRRIPMKALTTLLTRGVAPRPGDLLLARVEKLGSHRFLELESGRRTRLFAGDEIILAYGNRYASDQYEAFIPTDLESCHLVAPAGLAAMASCQHGRLSEPTVLMPIGFLGDKDGGVLNLLDFALRPSRLQQLRRNRPLTIAVVGAAMNCGKTETASHLIRGLCRAEFKVSAAKLTGTGSAADLCAMVDAGASKVLDFTDAGFASTYLLPLTQLEAIMDLIHGSFLASDSDAVVFEVGDGLYQQETSALLKSRSFRDNVDGTLFTALDSMGASEGIEWLRENRLPVIGVSGLLTTSPLATRETTAATGLPVISVEQLASPEIAVLLGTGEALSVRPSLAASA